MFDGHRLVRKPHGVRKRGGRPVSFDWRSVPASFLPAFHRRSRPRRRDPIEPERLSLTTEGSSLTVVSLYAKDFFLAPTGLLTEGLDASTWRFEKKKT